MREVTDLVSDGGIHDQRAHLSEHRHSLILLNVTSRYGVYDDFVTNIFHAGLIAGATDILYLDKLLLVI